MPAFPYRCDNSIFPSNTQLSSIRMDNSHTEIAQPSVLRMASVRELQRTPLAQTPPRAVKAMKGPASLCYRGSRFVSNSSKRTIARDDSRSFLTRSIMLADAILSNGGLMSESVCRTRRLPAVDLASLPALEVSETNSFTLLCR